MSSRDDQIVRGEPSGEMRYTSEPPTLVRLGKGIVAKAGMEGMAVPPDAPRLITGIATPVPAVGREVPGTAGTALRFSPAPAANMSPRLSTARAVISFLGALYRTKPSPCGEMR